MPHFHELTLVLAAPDNNPILLTPTFLKGSGIVPADWELARQPQLMPQLAQIAFTNGISLTAQPGSLTLSQPLTEPLDPDQIQIPQLAQQYARALPNLNYRALAINPRTFLTFPDEGEDAARNTITNFLAPAPWQTLGSAPLKANLTLTFTFENRQLNLNMTEVKLQQAGNPPQEAVLLDGRFLYKIEVSSQGEKFEQLKAKLDNWQTDWETYRDTLNAILHLRGDKRAIM